MHHARHNAVFRARSAAGFPRTPRRVPLRVSLGTVRLLLSSLLLLAGPAAWAADCPPEVATVSPQRCRLFTDYRAPGTDKPDERLASRIIRPDTASIPVRSYALLIGIDEYPNFEQPKDRTLLPARKDLANLLDFVREQGFDEVITLHNADATRENIDFFLGEYLNKQLDTFGPNARVLVAHSGHGGPPRQAGLPGSIVLSQARGGRDYPNVYPLGDLASRLRTLAANSFHFVALLGSCFSGGLFLQQSVRATNHYYPNAAGSHAVSSAPHDDLAYGVGEGQGSIFFDALIAGVRSGEGDTTYAGWISGGNGDLHRIGGGIVRLGALAAFVSSKIDLLGINPDTRKPFPQILLGSLASTDAHGGAFFFLGSPKVQQVDLLASNTPASTRDTGSALVGNASIKVFSAPDSYAITGIDVSHHNQAVDWVKVAAVGNRFAYMKATESVRFQDGFFARNWAGAAAAGMRRGAYHVFDFCAAAEAQLANLVRTVPRTAGDMPVAIDLQWRDGPRNQAQKRCGDVAATRRRLHELADGIESRYGKVPVIFANASGANDLLDEGFNKHPLWLQRFGTGGDPLENLRVKGGNPWTIWQFTERGRVPGITGDVDRDVFFGTAEALEGFAARGGNPALLAVR